MDTREAITNELLAGNTPAQLARKYPRKSVYRIYNELLDSGQLHEPGVTVVDSEDVPTGRHPFIRVATSPPETQSIDQPTTQTQAKEREPGTEVVDIGPASLPIEAINRIRGVLGISLRPKVLSCPTPELLYPAMVIAVTELGFPAMRPDDFIDTVLYQWLDACDIVPYAFMKKSELEELAKKYSMAEENIIKDAKFRREHGLVTTDEIKQAILEPLVKKEQEMIGEMESDIPENIEEPEEPIDEEEEVVTTPEPEPVEPQPHKPTVGELLGGLHINNIRKEVGGNGGTKRAEPNNS